MIWMYLRKSRALGDPDDPNLLAAHRSMLLRLFAEDHPGEPPPDIRQEIGSAERIDDRPVFRELLAEWERLPQGAGGVVYITELPRLTRGMVQDWARIEAALLRTAILIRTRSRLYDLHNPDDANAVDVEVLFGRFELRSMKRRAADKREEMRRAGQVLTGRVPSFGYRWNYRTRQPEPDPATFPLLQQACRAVLSTSIRKLAARFGVDPATLRDTLHNPLICAYPTQRWLLNHPTRGYRKRGHRLGPEEWRLPEQPASYEAACTREEWGEIQRVLAERATRRAKTGDENAWCRDVVQFIGAEGYARLSNWSDGYNGGRVPTYELAREGLPRLYIARSLVHAEAERALSALFARPSLLAAALEEYRTRTTAPAVASRDQPAVFRALSDARQKLATLLEREADPDEEIRAAARGAIGSIRNQIERLKAELAAIAAQAAARPQLDQVIEPLEELAPWWDAAFPSMDASLKRQITTACLAAIPVRVTPQPGRRVWLREVLPAVYADWLVPFMSE